MMLCPQCQRPVEQSFKFCPGCGFGLDACRQSSTSDVDTSAHQPSVSNTKEDPVPTGVKEEGNISHIKEQRNRDDFQRGQASPQDPPDNIDSQAVLGKEDTPTSPSLTFSVGESVTIAKLQVTEIFKEGEVLSAPAPECDPQPCSEAELKLSETPSSPRPASDKCIERHAQFPSDLYTEGSPEAVKVPADKSSDICTKQLSSSASSSRAEKQDQKQKSPDDNAVHSNPEQHKSTKQTDGKGDQAASAVPSKNIEAVDTVSNDNRSQNTAEDPLLLSKVSDVSSSPTSAGPPSQTVETVPKRTTSTEHRAPQSLPNSEHILVYFHAVTSKGLDFNPQRDEIYLVSEMLFGSWSRGGLKMSIMWQEDKRYFLEGSCRIHKNLIIQRIPYKYVIFKNSNRGVYEDIHHEGGNKIHNRCLTIQGEMLTHEGAWHQYDDMIYLELKSGWRGKSIKDTLIKGRNVAGKIMLQSITQLLTTWRAPDVDDFFLLLRQFFSSYSYPMLHDGMAKPWSLPYGAKEVNILLQDSLQMISSLLPGLHAGVVSLIIYTDYLMDNMMDQLSHLCKKLCLPNMPKDDFIHRWEAFASPFADKTRVADAVETLCNNARQHNIENWFLLIPLIHLLRGESKPFQPAPLVLKPQFDSQMSMWDRKKHNYLRGNTSVMQIMKDHAYLAEIDGLLGHSWISLLPLDDLPGFVSSVKVPFLDIMSSIHAIISGGSHPKYKALHALGSYLVHRASDGSESFADSYGGCCLKTAARLLGSICHHMTDPNRYDVPLCFLNLVCLISKAYTHTDSKSRQKDLEMSIGDALQTMGEWRRKTFPNKLLDKLNRTKFSVPSEITVWDQLLSLSFGNETSTEFWTETFLNDFKGRLKNEKPEDQIGIYAKEMKKPSSKNPLLCSSMEKCALEAMTDLCQDKSGKKISALLDKHDITKFGKLMSVIVAKKWPTDANGCYTEAEDLIFEYLLNWDMAKTILQMTAQKEQLINKLSDEAQDRLTLASSAFRSISAKFLSGKIQMKTLRQILQREHAFLDLLKIDGLCDDGRCKDDTNMRGLLARRKLEVEAVLKEKNIVKGLLQICQELRQHVKVDLKGLDEKSQQNTETMNLNTFMEVHIIDGQTSHTTGKVTYFNLSDDTHQMASKLHGIKGSVIFRNFWTNQIAEMFRENGDDSKDPEEIYTLDLVYSKIFQSCYNDYESVYNRLKSGEMLLEEIDIVFETYKGKKEDLDKELHHMCAIDPSDDRSWIRGRIHQIQEYHDLHLAMESGKIIMEIRNILRLEGDFKVLEKLLEMTQDDFKKNALNCIDEHLMKTKELLMNITDDRRRKCLQALSQSPKFVPWVKKELKDISELKVFVDLASISAGENDLEVDRVRCFHDAVHGYSSMLYGLEPECDFDAFMDSLPKLWKALENDNEIPEKMLATERLLDWLNSVKESHGSVEISSLSLASSINEKGIYMLKAQKQTKLPLESSLMLEIQEGHEETMTCTYEDLKELQNKLMLLSGRGKQKQSEVEVFAEVFDNVQRLAKSFVELHAAGNPLFRSWEAKIYCKPHSDPCIIMEIKFCKTLHRIQVCGDLVEQLTALSKKMEDLLEDWQKFIDQQRSDHYYLNYFTTEQIFYLCSVVTPSNMNEEIEDKALMMLSFIKRNCTTSDVWTAWRRFQNQFKPSERVNEDDDPEDTVDQTIGLTELQKLWNDYMKNEELLFHDLLDIRSLAGLLKIMTVTENQIENEWEEPFLSETKDNSLRRNLPTCLKPNQPNLLMCPHDDVLTSSICLYMNSEDEPLPSYDEVLLCTPATSYEQVELFLRRCLTPGDIGQKIYTMLWADQLTYDVSCAMEKCFHTLRFQFKHDYTLVIICSSDREHTYIPTAFSQFKRDHVLQAPLDKIQKYLSRNYTVPAEHKNAGFKRDFFLGIVASQRPGVGKSLYVQRLYERLEGTVEQGTAYKKCIRLTEHEVDDHKVLQSLYDTPRQKDLKVFHFDVTSSVQKGLNEFLFKLLFLRCLTDSDGQMWQCSHRHLYIIELMESMNDDSRSALRSGRKESFAFSDVFPKVHCHSPSEVMALEFQREKNPEMGNDDLLMDDECFRSEAYQRPYQYLTRFHNKNNLDKFKYNGIEGTHAKCLHILLFYCGIKDPSWAELRNFVWFLNLQLKDCEKSVFCKLEFVGDVLSGFKNFVVEFMILMSEDFATPSLCITDQSPGRPKIDTSGDDERDLAQFLIRKRWESEPHPYIFFNHDQMSMTFIGFHLKPNGQRGFDAINPLTKQVIKENIMTQSLYNGLKRQGVPFNTDFDKLPRAEKIETLCSVLGIKQPRDPDESYELTTDNVLKMMAIHMRFRCGIPVIIMGETGCGKTRLIKYMCELRKCGAEEENLKLVKVHGGTTSKMIHEKVEEAEALARTNKETHKNDPDVDRDILTAVLFFDEANTTEAVNSIKEIICDKSVQGQDLDLTTGLQIIAVCNPYRKHTNEMIERLEESGLGYRVRAEETEDRLGSIPLRQLVYRVHKLPPSMIPLVWDFGQLNDSTEKMYIEQMVQRQVHSNLIEQHYKPTITQVLLSSQKFMRQRKDECSFVSLRDAERCMSVFLWFHKNHPMFEKELRDLDAKSQKTNRFPPATDRVIWSLLMATGVCYQSCLEDKGSYWSIISPLLPGDYDRRRVVQEIQLMQDLFLSGVPMGKTIAKNEALKENFFMMVICVELRIPLFIVGKPGSSKSLSKTLVADAMQGPTSHSDLFKRLKQIHLVSFQCSPHSIPEGIINTFKQCALFQKNKNLDEYISVVVLDEIGLAEDSPKMPLKTLHPLLEEGCVDDVPEPHKRVGFIGISNWALDPAKMNRGIFVSRGELNEQELIKSAHGICASEEKVLVKIEHLFEPFAKAYMTVCKNGKGFFGLRDFYSLIKMVFSITRCSNECPTAEEITTAVLRNFSGKDDVDVMGIFSKELGDDFANVSIPTNDLVNQSISPPCQEDESRYLLILTKNYAALEILQQKFHSVKIQPEIIFGSSFPKDQEYTQICRNISRVKACMETGQTVVLLNLQNLYESLYDALNQYYVTLGGQKYVDLGLGTHRVKCRVHKNFRLIVIEEKEVVYKQFPIPMINRLEKHYLDINTVLEDEQKNVATQLQQWVDKFVSLSRQHLSNNNKQYVPNDVFIGYHSDACSSVVLQGTENASTDTDAQTILDKAKNILLNCATPDSVVRLDISKLPNEEREHLMKEYAKEEMHSSLGNYIAYHTQQLGQTNFFTEVTTFSRLLTASDVKQLQNVTELDHIRLLSLQQFDTEYSFLKKIREFLDSTPADKVLIIQTDYDEDSHRRNILSSAKYSCINEINKWATTNNSNTKTFVYFVTKLLRIEGGTSYVGFQGGPWRSVHIDDLRRSKEFMCDVHALKNLRISNLFEDPPEVMETEYPVGEMQHDSSVVEDWLDTTVLLKSCVQSAVSMLRDAADNRECSTSRVENLLTLLDGSQTQDGFANVVRKRLHLLLEEYEANIPSPKDWVLKEASNISALQEGGTFLHTLWRKIQSVIIPLLANLISVVDRDCNLDLVLKTCDDTRKLWLEIFGNKEMLHVPHVRVESNSVLLVQSHITGGNTMQCLMPFSWWIKDFLDRLMMQTSRHDICSPQHYQDLFLKTPLGSYFAKNVTERMKKEFFENYLQDFVSMTVNAGSDEEMQLSCEALTSCIHEARKQRNDGSELSLPHIHIGFNIFKRRLQNLSRMISLQPDIVSLLRNKQLSRQCDEMVLDVYAAMACLEQLKSPNVDTEAHCQDWLKQVKRIQASVEMICSQPNAEQKKGRSKQIFHDVSHGWRRIYILSLFVEHMLLGIHNEEIHLQPLVLSHFQTLSKALEEHSDVKSMQAFKGVIEVLKSCKQGASDQIFRYGHQCVVCLKEPQDPAGLPCHHICCITCITQSQRQTSCPFCRQEFPDDFQPDVSEEVRDSIKKNKAFSRRCNGFFIDLLSAVCFKDNSPPSKDVIRNLLSYLRIETEHNQIHTKDLSPFDESLDKNPVVRSVILKLLLKFSFGEVKDYLQDHLSLVEDSRFVDEEDKAQLYALYINCLEDSMWEKMPQEGSRTQRSRAFFDGETQFLQFFLDEVASLPETVSIQHLQHIAHLRLSLTVAAQLISDSLPDNNVPDEAEDFLTTVTKFCKDSRNDWYRVYLIRKLSECQGVTVVQTLVREHKFSWLFPKEIILQTEHEGQMDQFLLYGEEYTAVRDAVAKALIDGDVQHIDDTCQKSNAPPSNRAVFILLALFREVTTLYRSANASLHPTPEQCQNFEDFVQGSSYLCERQQRDFASALVHNRLGVLAVHPGHPIEELTIHMAAVLLTCSHPLLMPLKQLGLTPQNMQRAFIPTMPDDMLAVAQEVIKQRDNRPVTWYVCPNKHPFLVDLCGSPTQRGKCLECGAKVGVEGNVRFPGFQQIQPGQDQTKPGHILGDPEQRKNLNALDTKNMSLAPFTLVRLVTHLAMLLGAGDKPEFVGYMIQPRVEDVPSFLALHSKADLDQLSKALGKGFDDTVTAVHLVLRSLQELNQTSHSDIDPHLKTKTSRNHWETTVAAHVMTPQLQGLDQSLPEAKDRIRTDPRVSSNFILKMTSGDDCSFLMSLAKDSQVHSSAVWSCRNRLSLLSLAHIVGQQSTELPLLWRFLEKEREFQHIKLLPHILILQRRLVRKFQNTSDQIMGSIREFIEKQRKELQTWYKEHIEIFLTTWNLLRISVNSYELKIPEEFCSTDLDLDSDLRYLLPRRQGPGLCATGLVSYLVTLHNELVNAVDSHTGEDSSNYKVALADLTEQHVICYEVEKDLLPLVLSNCQYSLERGHETISQYDLPRIQQQIITHFLRGKPLITHTGIPTLVNTQDRYYETVFKAVQEKVPQDILPSLTWNAVSRALDYSMVCETLKITELVMGFLSMTGGDPMMLLVAYLQDILKMADHIDHHILQALRKCNLKHCICLWQHLSSLKSEKMLHLKREPFSGYPAEYQQPLEEENKRELKGFMSRAKADQWLLEIHEFLLLSLSRPLATADYSPDWSVKEVVVAYMERKGVDVPSYVEQFPDHLLLSQIVETWKYAATSKQAG